MRARLVADALREIEPATISALRRHPRLALWVDEIFEDAVTANLDSGVIFLLPTGELAAVVA